MTSTNPLSPISGYHLIEKLGEGASGEVWKAEKEGQVYAVKLLKPGLESPVFETFDLIKGLRHPNIIREYETGTRDGRPCLVMEYLEGQPLKKVRAARFSPVEQKRIINELAGALDFLHQQGLVHQNLNPANIFLLTDGTVKILDIDVPAPAADSPGAGTPRGAFQYAAPEQLTGRAYPKSNIWSFGVIIYEWLTGSHPYPCYSRKEMAKMMLVFQAEVPHYLNEAIPPSTSVALLRCLRVKPEERPADFSEVRAYLERDPKETLASAFGRSQKEINRFLWKMFFRKADRMNRESEEAFDLAALRTEKDIDYRLLEDMIRRAEAWSKTYLWVSRLFLACLLPTLVYFILFRTFGQILSGNEPERLLPWEYALIFGVIAVMLLSGIILNLRSPFKFDLELGLPACSTIVDRKDFITLVDALSGAFARISGIQFHQAEMKEKEVLLPWLWKNGREKMSRKLIRQLLKGNHRNRTALSFRLFDALGKGNTAAARACLQKILEADPRHFAALLKEEAWSGRNGRRSVRRAYVQQEMAHEACPASQEDKSAPETKMAEKRSERIRIGAWLPEVAPLILFAGIILITEVFESDFGLRFFLFIDGVADQLAFRLAAWFLGDRQEAFNWLMMHTAAVERAGRIVFWILALIIVILVFRLIVRPVRKRY